MLQEVRTSLVQMVQGITGAASGHLTTGALDSLGALELRDAIAVRFAVSLPATAAYDYPNLQASDMHCSNASLSG